MVARATGGAKIGACSVLQPGGVLQGTTRGWTANNPTKSHRPARKISRETFTPLPPLRVHCEVVVHEFIHELGQVAANRVG